MTAPRYVTYFRVSTQLQRRSGLGLDAQRKSVERFLAANPGRLIEELTEIESGKKNNRPKFERALWLCRVYDAKLVIARLDRLARNTAVIAKLIEEKVDFVAADMPLANRFAVHLLAAVAEYEFGGHVAANASCPCDCEGAGTIASFQTPGVGNVSPLGGKGKWGRDHPPRDRESD